MNTGIRYECPLIDLYRLLVVLDEGHTVANPETVTSQSVQAVLSKHKLIMTGTPLMNEYTDIQSLMSFLRIKPWSNPETFQSV